MKIEVLTQLQNLPYFTKNTLRVVTDESANTLDVSNKRMFNRGQLVKLKNGFYVTKYYLDKNGHLAEYREFISSVLSQPSYLSLEYVLGKHDILTEGVRAFTAITLKTTRSYENKLGSFLYKNISKSYFMGFETKVYANNTYFIASKAKALFDYLYFFARMNDLKIKSYDIIKERRLRVELLSKQDWAELMTYLRIKKGKKISFIKEKLKPYAPD